MGSQLKKFQLCDTLLPIVYQLTTKTRPIRAFRRAESAA
jgi:hypothetical protein